MSNSSPGVSNESTKWDTWVALTESHPEPFSVISERAQQNFNIPEYPDEECYSFGKVYEDSLVNLIIKHSDLMLNDRVAYIGGLKGSLAPFIQQDFDLITPIACYSPIKKHEEETQFCSKKLIENPYEIAETYFETNSKIAEDERDLFEKILVVDCLPLIEDVPSFLKLLGHALAPEGIVLIIHRPGTLATLPLFQKAKERYFEMESARPYVEIMRNLQSLNFDIEWEIETLPVAMLQTKWLHMIQRGYQCEICDSTEIAYGIRELVEGMMKYHDQEIEFFDRLLFVAATHQLPQSKVPVIKRSSRKNEVAQIFKLPYKMDIDDDVKKYFADKEEEKKRTQLERWTRPKNSQMVLY